MEITKNVTLDSFQLGKSEDVSSEEIEAEDGGTWQELPAAPRSWERIWTDLPSEPARGTDLVSTLVTKF